jgi:hypothetical protein
MIANLITARTSVNRRLKFNEPASPADRHFTGVPPQSCATMRA